jgi:hypothetical protein
LYRFNIGEAYLAEVDGEAKALGVVDPSAHPARDPEVFIYRHVISALNELAHKAQAKSAVSR